HVDVDRGQMDQVLLNLFVNAWQAMPDGGNLYISVKNVELSKKEMNALGTSGKRFVKITVSDTGAGMDEKIMSRVFEPFFTTKEQSQNTGMGLASAYGIIRNHGGYIQVESRPGRGTSFIIYLPPSNHKAQDEPQKESRIYKGTETILLIDDEQMIIDVASRILEELGYKVLSATSAKKGIEIFQNSKEIINLVVLDMIMPGISGKEAFDILRQADPSVKVLLSSGFSVDSQAKDIMAAGCRGFIQKPFTMAQLSQKVRQILDGDLPPDNDRLPPPPTAATPPQNH
ncbi:MAG TPA: response regulator, partial [Smithellaceae bacterium]|nr:response regulator [Smithellaceae bacterium]